MNDQHNNAALPFVTALLGVLVVLETIALGYVTTGLAKKQIQQPVVTSTEQVEDVADVPFVYIKDHRNVVLVDRETGEERVVYTEEGTDVLGVLAVPQIGFAGKIYLSTSCTECDSHVFLVKELDLSQDVPTLISITDGGFERGSVAVSPDQTHFAYVYLEPVQSLEQIWSSGNSIVVRNLLTGEEETVTDDTGRYFFSTYFSNSMGSGVEGFQLNWVDRECVRAATYERPQTGIPLENGRMSFPENREYCLE